MSNSNRIRITARIVAVRMICAALPVAAAHANGRVTVNPQTCGSPTDPIEVLLPFEMQASYFHSLPIAGLLVTPDDIGAARDHELRARVPRQPSPFPARRARHTRSTRSRFVGTRADQFP